MMRRARAVVGILWLWALPGAAFASGSSTVSATSTHFAVDYESPRKIFAQGDGEAEWHADWRKQHQRIANKLKQALMPLVETPESLETLGLHPYDKQLPEVRDDAFEDYPSLVKQPFRCHYREGAVNLYVVYKRRPTAAQQRALRKILASVVKRVVGD